MLIRIYCSQQPTYRQKAAAELFSVPVRVTPSRFVLRQPWDSERSAGFDFTSLKPKNVRRSRIRRIRRLTNRLDAFAAIKSLLLRRQRSPFLRPSTETGPGAMIWSFRLENRIGRSLSLLEGGCISGFAARPSVRRQRRQLRIRRPFLSFWPFFVFNSSDDKIYLNHRQDLVPIRIVNQHFNSCRLLAALARAAVKMRASVIARTGGGGGF